MAVPGALAAEVPAIFDRAWQPVARPAARSRNCLRLIIMFAGAFRLLTPVSILENQTDDNAAVDIRPGIVI